MDDPGSLFLTTPPAAQEIISQSQAIVDIHAIDTGSLIVKIFMLFQIGRAHV